MAPTTSAATRILHITRNLPPLVGGMERLNWHIADELSRYAQVQLIGPEGSSALRPTAVQVTEVPLRPLPRYAQLPRDLVLGLLPDIVHPPGAGGFGCGHLLHRAQRGFDKRSILLTERVDALLLFLLKRVKKRDTHDAASRLSGKLAASSMSSVALKIIQTRLRALSN